MGNSDLQPIVADELRQGIFSPGDIYWCKEAGGKVKILSAGDPIDLSSLKKYFDRNALLMIDRYLNLDVLGEAKIYFSGLERAKNEVQRLRQRQNLIRWFSSIFWSGKNACSMVDLMHIGSDVFYRFTPDMTDAFRQVGVNLFKRSGIISSMGVFLALLAGHTDFKFLQDLYHLTYLFDCAFTDGISFNMNRASELEREQSGEGVAYLFLGDNPGPELKQFVSHPAGSLQKAKELFAPVFNNPTMIEYVIIHHEKINGKGFPAGLHADMLSDFEALLILINHMMPYSDILLEKDGGIGLLKSAIIGHHFEETNEVLTGRLSHFIVEEINRNSIDRINNIVKEEV